jgi:NDP-sugar pyrophosphorylase family protein
VNPSRDCLKTIDVAILAGGLGTRISHALDDTPKILAPIDGRPFLSIVLEWLAGFGARRVVLGLGHLAQVVLGYLEESPPEGIEVITVIEAKPLGTAGAIRFLGNKIERDPVLVMNGDTLVGADLCAFVASHAASGAEASLLCTEMDDTVRYGRVDVAPDGRIRGYEEKSGAHPAPGIVNAGVYLFGAAMMARITASSDPSLECDIFPALPPGCLHAMTGRFPFVDIGTPESLNAASAVVTACLKR